MDDCDFFESNISKIIGNKNCEFNISEKIIKLNTTASNTTQLNIKQRRCTFHAFKVMTLGEKDATLNADKIWKTLTNPDNFSNGISKLTTKHLSSGFSVELRDFSTDGNIAIGCVAQCREDSPPLRKQDGSEVLRHLSNGEALLEKNFFLYDKDECLLLWHFNLAANGYTTFANMLNVLSGGLNTFICVPFLKDSDVDLNNVEIEYVDFTVSMPKSAKERARLVSDDPTDWGGFNVFKTMNEMDTQRISAKLTAKRTKSFGRNPLSFITKLSNQKNLRKLRVKIEDCEEPIDVIASRFKATQNVNYHSGKYLDIASMFAALRDARVKFQQVA